MLSYFLKSAVNIYSFLILVYILSSWVPECRNTQWYQYLSRYIEPFFAIFRRFVPRLGLIDITPMIALLSLELGIVIVLRILRFVILNILHSPWLLQYI